MRERGHAPAESCSSLDAGLPPRVRTGDGRKPYRLNPEIGVEGVSWETLARHPNEAMRKIAAEMVKRKGRGVELKA